MQFELVINLDNAAFEAAEDNLMQTTGDYQSLIVSQVHSCTREQLIDWLVWNDPHGVYTDSDCQNEDYPILTLESARLLVIKVITGE